MMSALDADGILASINACLDRAEMLNMPGDELVQFLSGRAVFTTGDNKPGSITIPVPRDGDFYAQRMDLYLGARILNQTDPLGDATDQAFRPAGWVSIPNSVDADDDFQVQAANATFSITDTYHGSYQGGGQNIPLQVAAAYSHRFGQGSVDTEVIMSAWPGGRPFFIPHKLKRGSALTMNFQPTFSRLTTATTKTQFQLELVLTGYTVLRRAL